jgi:peptide/nickel transport system ATP-binding protein
MRAHAGRRPPELSGGQQQRIAIACALANHPAILLGDEPTGEVDWPTAQAILALLRDLRDRYGLTIVIVTHDPRVAEQSDRTVAIRDGRTSSETIYAEYAGSSNDTSAEQAIAPSAGQAQELVVVDAAGRLQLPRDQRMLAGIGRRARIEVVDGGVLIRPGDDERDPAEPPAEEGYEQLYGAGGQRAPRRARWRLPWRRGG